MRAGARARTLRRLYEREIENEILSIYFSSNMRKVYFIHKERIKLIQQAMSAKRRYELFHQNFH